MNAKDITILMNPDGTVVAPCREPLPYWQNSIGATLGRHQFQGDKPASVEQPRQPVNGMPRCGGVEGAPTPEPDIMPRASRRSSPWQGRYDFLCRLWQPWRGS